MTILAEEMFFAQARQLWGYALAQDVSDIGVTWIDDLTNAVTGRGAALAWQ